MKLSIALGFAALWCALANGQSVVTVDNAQAKLVRQYESAVQTLREDRDFPEVLEKTAKLLEQEPSFIDALILQGEAHYRLGNTIAAIDDLEAAASLDSVYDSRVFFSLSKMYEQRMEYRQARKTLERYMRLVADPERVQTYSKHLNTLECRQELIDNPVPFDPIPVPGMINSGYDEALPAVTIDGSTMIFTRRIDGYEDLYISAWDTVTSEWIATRPMSAVNSPQNEGAHAISANGRVLVFTSCNRQDGQGSCDLYLTFRRGDGKWSAVRNLRALNTRGWEGQPALTADGRGLYFSSDRPGGFGGRDLWFTRITDQGWTPPENLGGVINTEGNESSPFVHRDDVTLYFMSDGHPGMGDYDLFISRTDIDTSWSIPQNLGYPINTPGREGALTVHPDGLTAFYTKEDPSTGTMDIFQFDLPPSAVPDPVSYIDVAVTDAATGRPLQALTWIYAIDDSLKRDRYVTDAEGMVTAGLPHGKKYGLHITAPDYLFYSGQFNMAKTEPHQRIRVDVRLERIVNDTAEISAPVVLRNVEFESGSAKLLAGSESELMLLYQLLESRQGMKVEIRGHTDNVGAPDDNLQLSEERAEVVYNWLVARGIDATRLIYNGFGETQPVDTNDTEEGRQRNRRTEFVVIN